MKLNSLLLTGALVFSCATTPKLAEVAPDNVFRMLGIPERFVGYKETIKINETYALLDNGEAFLLSDYSNGKMLVREIRKIGEMFSLVSGEEKNPGAFYFDLNNDNFFDDNELLIDAKRDGLNGNEVWWREINPENTKYNL